jgi:hypothetical protein
MKTFTLDEAQSLLPLLESLLKRAIESKKAAEAIEGQLQQLRHRIFLSGGLMVDILSVTRQRAEAETLVRRAKDAVAEIQAIGVQVKDLETGLLDFPCILNDEVVLLCWKMGEPRIDFWHTVDADFRGRRPVDERFGRSKKPN